MSIVDLVDPQSALYGWLCLRAAEWVAVAALEYKVAKAKADGVEDWQDSYWLAMLRRVDSARAERVERSQP